MPFDFIALIWLQSDSRLHLSIMHFSHAEIGVIFLLLMWRLCQNRCTGETLFLTVILVYFLMENKCFLFSADPFILLLPAALFPAKGKPLPVVCPPVTRGCI